MAGELCLGIELVPVGDLRPYGRNPRRNDGAVRRMARSIEEYGFVHPVLATGDGEVVDGHLRLKAAAVLGLKRVPVMRVEGLDAAGVKAARIALNQAASWAKWDVPLLRMEMEDLRAADFDLEPLGFGAGFYGNLELSDALAGGGDGYGDGGDGGGPAVGGPGGGGKASAGKTPVTVVLGPGDYGRWEAFKGRIGERSDTRAFLRVLEALEA
ncbi:MAG: ParB/Srx family N-terminal domain-containing protein [Deltaproteobacteria bacterium]|jgi:hypothetical protein|nr:ParB/Srx family N-terminal domain-containing protein [Deltaproteobacteria bacterium]